MSGMSEGAQKVSVECGWEKVTRGVVTQGRGPAAVFRRVEVPALRITRAGRGRTGVCSFVFASLRVSCVSSE